MDIVVSRKRKDKTKKAIQIYHLRENLKILELNFIFRVYNNNNSYNMIIILYKILYNWILHYMISAVRTLLLYLSIQ